MCWINSNGILKAQLCFHKFLFMLMDQTSLKQQTGIKYGYQLSWRYTVQPTAKLLLVIEIQT
jgi:hypothetical protein